MHSETGYDREQELEAAIWSVPYMHFTFEINQAKIVRSALLVDERTSEGALRSRFHIMEDVMAWEAAAQEVRFRRERWYRRSLD